MRVYKQTQAAMGMWCAIKALFKLVRELIMVHLDKCVIEWLSHTTTGNQFQPL